MPSARRLLQVIVGCAVMAALLVAPTTALGAPLPGSAFDSGDGNEVDGLGLDWQGAGAVVQSPDANDDCFVGGVKELNPNGWAFNTSAGGCTPGKSNIRVAFANPESTAGTTFGHFAFFRNDTTGNTFLTFELNQVGTSWTNGTGTTIPCRSNGDLLLSFEVGGSTLLTTVYRWLGDDSGPPACRNGAAGSFTGSGTVPPSRFQGAMNSAAAIANAINPAAYGASFPANSFGEAAIDLPAVLQSMGQSPCFGYLQMQVHSRSSSSISSAMIDYTQPVPIHLQSCSVTGTEYQDTNGNGTREAGEPGVAGFDVYADLDDDGVRDTGEPSGTSDATGFYRILAVPAGAYKIRQVARAGWLCSQPSPCFYSRSLTLGGNSIGNDFGNLAPSSTSGTAFHDLDADGVRDAGEPGRPAVDVYVDLDDDGTRDAGEPLGTSGADGTWTIPDIPAGTFKVRAVAQAGWTCSAPVPCHAVLTFSSGASPAGPAFGVYSGATIAGNLFEDVDGDGAAQAGGDPNLGGWQVYLDANASDTFDVGERQTVTDGAGAYAFAAVAPGPQAVRVTNASPAWYCTRPALAACERDVTPVSAQALTGQSFGLTRTANVSGTKFADGDGNGIKDAGDGALAGFTFWVDYNADNVRDASEPSATSDAAGAWTISGVRAGAWTLREAPVGAYACTKPSPCTYALTLTSNAAVTGYQFGNYVSRSVSGVVFGDADADGVNREAGEAGVSGWVVYSDANSNSAKDAGEPTSTTNALGEYNLTGLANGSYKIRVVGQAGWNCSYPASCLNSGSIGSGQSDANLNFGVWGVAHIAGAVFEDADADGAAHESGEPPLAGRVVYVDTNNNSAKDGVEPGAITDAAGLFSIAGVNPGTYTVRQVLPGGWTCSRPAPCSYSVTISAGDVGGRDFASYTTGTLAGVAYEDRDASAGRDAGEPGIASRTVYLDTNDNAAHDGGEPSASTDGTGAYTFGALAPGTYRVRQVLPGGWTQTAPAAAQTLAVGSGATVTATSLGSHTTATISGTVFEDADFDGSAFEAGDAPQAGRTVYLDLDASATKDAGEPVSTTSALGAYSFSGLAPGTYTVRAIGPAGWACAYPATCSHEVTVASQAIAAGRDFGTYVGASVSGTVFEDADADGAPREAGDAGLVGRRVFLDADADSTRDASEPTTLTDAAGDYAFSGIVARAWTVRLEPSAGWSCDSPAGCGEDVTLSSGSSSPGVDFGTHTRASVSGHLFTDRDNNGQPQVFGENDQPGRTVYADINDNLALDAGEPAATTDDRGDYTLGGLEPAAYHVRQVLPAGWTCSTPTPCAWTVALTSGQAALGRDFSSWTTAALSGTLFEDLAGDGGFPEAGDPGVGGRIVYVDSNDDNAHDLGEPITTSDSDGRYAFSDLAPGDYVVRTAGSPAGWTCSYPTPCSQELTLEAGERAQDVSFGAWTTGTVAGVAFEDTDESGGRDLGEEGLEGRTIYADLDDSGTQNLGEPSTLTTATGAYELTLDPGTYKLRQSSPAGWGCTSPAGCVRDVTILSESVLSGRDFGSLAAPVTTISGVVFADQDADGTSDSGDGGRDGVTVWVDADDDGTIDGGEPQVSTAAGGQYVFTAIAAGTWNVRVAPGAGWACSAPADCVHSVTLAAGQTASARDFATWTGATVTGELYDDADGDGAAREAGEGAIGAGVTLKLGNLTVTSAASSPATGSFELTGVKPGTYTLVTDLGGGRTCTRPSDCSRSISVVSGEQRGGQDFGGYTPATASGTVHDDLDGDGTIDGSEPGAALGVVWDDTDGNGLRDAGEPYVTAAADGRWTLDGLAPGPHTFRLKPISGAACKLAAACAASSTLASGATPAAIDFAAYRTTSIAGTVADGGTPASGVAVYLDTNGDGTHDVGEPTVTTGAGGTYAFNGLAPGAYAVRLDLAPTTVCSAPADCRHAITLTSGEPASDRDFSVYGVTGLYGTVSEDADASGLVDAGEHGYEGRVVYLDSDGDGTRDDGEPSTTTAADGTYAFTNLAVGPYTVRLDLPAGTTCSVPGACAFSGTLASGQSAGPLDFGAWRSGSISGLVFNDRDGDGTRDAGEPVRADVPVFADLDDDGEADAAEPAALTGADGRYTLTAVRPGARVLRVQAPADWVCTWTATCRATATVSSGADTVVADLGLHKSTQPAAGDLTSSGPSGAAQTRIVPVPAGGSVTLLDGEGSPTLSVTIPGQGTYTLDAATGVVTFTPQDGFSGAADPVDYRVIDADGASADAAYAPTVTPPVAAPLGSPQPPAASPAAPAAAVAPAQASAPPCVSLRTMTIHWNVARGVVLRRITITVNGTPYVRLPGSARKAVIDMKGRPPQMVRVRIGARNRHGTPYAARRTYRTCVPHLDGPRLPTLHLRRTKG
jgi:CshA-type fibril repeat protein